MVEESNALERVRRAVLAPIFKRLPPPSVLDMASSHAWNLGATNTCNSGAMACWNRGEWERGCSGSAGVMTARWCGALPATSTPRKTGKVFTFVQGLASSPGRRNQVRSWHMNLTLIAT